MMMAELVNLYDRLAADESIERPIARDATEAVIAVRTVIVLDEAGRAIGIRRLYAPGREGDDMAPGRELIAFGPLGRTSISPYFLVDGAKYLLACGGDAKAHDASVVFHKDLLGDVDNVFAQAVLAFLIADDQTGQLKALGFTADDAKKAGNVTFALGSVSRLATDEPVFRDVWRGHSASRCDDAVPMGFDAVTGTYGPLTTKFAKTSMPGATQQLSLVSAKAASAGSYGMVGTETASVGAESAFKVGEALRWLMGDRRRRVTVGDTTFVTWSEDARVDGAVSEMFSGSFFDDDGPARAEDDDVTRGVARGIWSASVGRSVADVPDTAHYWVLGLGTCAIGRLSVRYFAEGSFGDLKRVWDAWADDCRVAGLERPVTLRGLTRQLASASGAKSARELDGRVPPTMLGQLGDALFSGGPLPVSYQAALVDRARAERMGAGPRDFRAMERVAALKACHIRRHRADQADAGRRIDVGLNRENTEAGYLCGRLFAICAKAQADATGGVNAGVVEKYMAAASSTPAAVFGNLLRGYEAHVSKLRRTPGKEGFAVNLERWMGEVMGLVSDAGLPATLSLDGQTLFYIGYYQQTRAFYEKKIEKNTDDMDEE